MMQEPSLTEPRYPQAAEVNIIVDNMKLNTNRITAIFERYYEAQRKSNFWGPLQLIHFSLGSSGKELEKLITTIDRLATDLERQFSLNDIINKKQGQVVVHQPFYGAAKQRNVKIMFVDPGNTGKLFSPVSEASSALPTPGRSVVAHAYAQLVAEWTRRTNNPWFITNIHSAGLYIRKPNGLTKQQDTLSFPNFDAGRRPSKVALDSLFDNRLFNYDYKQTIKDRIAARSSHGLPNNMFKDFDYIFVFTFQNSLELQRLKKLAKQAPNLGEAFVPEGKCRIVMLGEYRDKNSCEIFGPKMVGGVAKRDDWNKCTSKIKLAFKGWLKEELDWVQPPRGAPQN